VPQTRIPGRYGAPMTRMLLVRHGQSEWNAVGRWQGQADPPLSGLGRAQARQAAGRIGTVDLIVSSDLERAMTTAAIIGDTLGVGPVIIEPRLRERSAGEWSGLTRAQIDEQWPGYLEENRRPPAFEPDDELALRVTAALVDIHATYGDAEILVVTHGGVVYVLEDDAGLVHARLPNLNGRWLTYDDNGISLGDRIELVTDAEPVSLAAGAVVADDEQI
jgi:broad specificity phosphatase PhoE